MSTEGYSTPMKKRMEQSQVEGSSSTPGLKRSSQDSSKRGVHSIASLDLNKKGWKIRARVIHRSDMQHYSNDKGPGCFFKVIFLDDSGEICCTGFNEWAHAYFDKFTVGEVYYISNCLLQNAKQKYDTVKNKNQMTLGRDSRIEICPDYSRSTVPDMKFNFVKLSDLEKYENDSLVDVIGVVVGCDDVVPVPSKLGSMKRDLRIIDGSKMRVTLTLWGETAKTFDGENSPVVAVKRAKVTYFNEKTLSVLVESPLRMNPNLKEADDLRIWFDDECKDLDSDLFETGGERKFPEQIYSLGSTDDSDNIQSQYAEDFRSSPEPRPGSSSKRPRLHSPRVATEEDQFDSYGKTIAHKLRDLPREQSLIAENFCNVALFEASFGNLTRETTLSLNSPVADHGCRGTPGARGTAGARRRILD
ncbi:replication protein A 70 kDa DNA-binding subunit isoform X2 [Aplysia californica]|uniref:Replication protein A 70 kDa DNA-binding subunit isoform X1 n=1 Tax=Aplysia californica TaxID=6500 RepID=A0ABM0K2Q3_APLCA|nr:replication protein A 70 kDa DNA-binding subunit isoform X1 [Aplysia californica]XP_005107379.1 replication protein A 70 kDa DNA-binding subunit isoform X2 [Aplysia californica]